MMKSKLLVLLIIFCSFSYSQSKGTISGIVREKSDSKSPIAFVNVKLKGTNIGVTTDEKGLYTFTVNPGNYIVEFSSIGFTTEEEAVKVNSGETAIVNRSLKASGVQLSDVVVKKVASREKETAILLEQKKAVEMKQSIGAQEMSRKGISDVEDGLTKITGISKVDGRGLFVRGLEDRYNTLLINDLAVPSNNPFKKIIPLDLFSTDIVSVIETYKTFNTNLYGDFAGGTFNIVTAKGAKSETAIKIGFGYTTGSSLKKFLLSKDASSTADYFGFSGNERSFPAFLGNVPRNKVFSATESISQIGSGFDVEEKTAPLNTGLNFSHTEKFDVGKNNNSIQYILVLGYDNKYLFREGIDRIFSPGAGNYDNNLYNKQYKFTTNTTLLGAVNYKTDRLSLTSNTFYLKTTENMIQDQLGYTNNAITNTNGFIRLNELQETSFFNTQLLSSYNLTADKKQTFKAGISYTKTNYQLPDRKSFKGSKIDNNTTFVNYTGSGISRQYFNFDGKYYLSGLLEYKLKFGAADLEKAHQLTIGYNGYINNVESTFRTLKSQNLSSTFVLTNTNKPDAALKEDIQNEKFTYSESTNSTYRAKLNESVNAGYFDLAFKLGEKIDLNAGTRFEQTKRETNYRKSGSFDAPFESLKVDKLDVLPSLNTKFKMNEDANLRFTASKTITRPVIMEAYPLEFVNPDSTIEQGNENLKNSENFNFDLKYELFPSKKELVAITAFSKRIKDPIEKIFIPSAGSGGQIINYSNSEKAILYGIELEFLFQLERISKNLKDFSLGFNTSLMQSKVTIDPIKNADENSLTRKLQGASPWIMNADLKYEFNFNQNWKNTLTLVYNTYSKRIYAVGTKRTDHYYEMPFDKLDLVWQNKIGKNIEIKFSIDNILNPYYRIELGKESIIEIQEYDLKVREYKKGMGVSIDFGYRF
jgi:outer membrane receptor protein involved in Fe transport